MGDMQLFDMTAAQLCEMAAVFVLYLDVVKYLLYQVGAV
jgi:hypothetical protein